MVCACGTFYVGGRVGPADTLVIRPYGVECCPGAA